MQVSDVWRLFLKVRVNILHRVEHTFVVSSQVSTEILRGVVVEDMRTFVLRNHRDEDDNEKSSKTMKKST